MMLWGIAKKPVVVFTDNKALSSFLQCPTLPASLCKYVDRLLQFRFVPAHVSGEDNPVADYLSRMYLNPQLLIELEIGARLPVHEVQVKLKPNIPVEQAIPNEDGAPLTPSPPETPKPEREEEMEMPLLTANVLQLTHWYPEGVVNALSLADPLNKLQLSSKQDCLNICQEQDKDENIRIVKNLDKTEGYSGDKIRMP